MSNPRKFMILFSTKAEMRRAANLISLAGIPYVLDDRFFSIWTDNKDEAIETIRKFDIVEMEVIDFL